MGFKLPILAIVTALLAWENALVSARQTPASSSSQVAALSTPVSNGLLFHAALDKTKPHGKKLDTLLKNPIWFGHEPTIHELNGRAGWSFTGAGDAVRLSEPMALPSTYTIMTWFFYPISHQDKPTHFTWLHGSLDGLIVVSPDLTLGNFDGTTRTGFHGTGFSLKSLDDGWHHLAVSCSGATCTYYVDFRNVGTTDFMSRADFVEIGNRNGQEVSGTTLSDVRLYDGVLSGDDIRTYASQLVGDEAGAKEFYDNYKPSDADLANDKSAANQAGQAAKDESDALLRAREEELRRLQELYDAAMREKALREQAERNKMNDRLELEKQLAKGQDKTEVMEEDLDDRRKALDDAEARLRAEREAAAEAERLARLKLEQMAREKENAIQMFQSELERMLTRHAQEQKDLRSNQLAASDAVRAELNRLNEDDRQQESSGERNLKDLKESHARSLDERERADDLKAQQLQGDIDFQIQEFQKKQTDDSRLAAQKATMAETPEEAQQIRDSAASAAQTAEAAFNKKVGELRNQRSKFVSDSRAAIDKLRAQYAAEATKFSNDLATAARARAKAIADQEEKQRQLDKTQLVEKQQLDAKQEKELKDLKAKLGIAETDKEVSVQKAQQQLENVQAANEAKIAEIQAKVEGREFDVKKEEFELQQMRERLAALLNPTEAPAVEPTFSPIFPEYNHLPEYSGLGQDYVSPHQEYATVIKHEVEYIHTYEYIPMPVAPTEAPQEEEEEVEPTEKPTDSPDAQTNLNIVIHMPKKQKKHKKHHLKDLIPALFPHGFEFPTLPPVTAPQKKESNVHVHIHHHGPTEPPTSPDAIPEPTVQQPTVLPHMASPESFDSENFNEMPHLFDGSAESAGIDVEALLAQHMKLAEEELARKAAEADSVLQQALDAGQAAAEEGAAASAAADAASTEQAAEARFRQKHKKLAAKISHKF